jgi:CRP-like cAMP-binding protein
MRDRVRSQPLFAGVADDRIDDLAASASERLAAPGEVLVERGQPASGMFVVEEGRVVVELAGRGVELGPGDVFGEIGLVGLTEGRTARVRAIADTRCLSFSRADVERVLAHEPELASRLRALAEKRLAEQRPAPTTR